MARRPEAAERNRKTARRQSPAWLAGIWHSRFPVYLGAGLLLLATTVFAWSRTVDFLVRDDRFRLPEAETIAGKSSNLILEGVHYASPSQIRYVFAQDFGRSLYLVPLQKRREQLRAIDWVQEASVSKIWPNTLVVRVHERVPVAFVHLRPSRRDGAGQFALIDKDGYILRPRVAARFTLPVVTGLRENESLTDRALRVGRMLAMLKEIGPLAEEVSEINVADLNNLIVAEHVDNRVINLMLGEESYLARLKNFVVNYDEIKARRPDAMTLDLRVDGVITAVGEENGK